MNLHENITQTGIKTIVPILFLLCIVHSPLIAQNNSPDRWQLVERWVGNITYDIKGGPDVPVGLGALPGNTSLTITYDVVLDYEDDRTWRGIAKGHGSMEAYAEHIYDLGQHTISNSGQGSLEDKAYLRINYRHGHYTIGITGRPGPISVHYREKMTIGAGILRDIDETVETDLAQVSSDNPFQDRPKLPESGLVLSGTLEFNFPWESHKLTWSLRPADERPHPCDNTDIREGIISPEAEMLRESIAAALAARGARIGPEHVVVLAPEGQESLQGFDMLRYTVPLQSTDNQPRHNMNCLVAKMESGEIEPGTLIGAGEMIFGMVQQVGGKTRITMRRTKVETAIVINAGMSTVEGTGHDAVTQAATEAAETALSGLQFY
ncbi:MAG: hypothetical protein LC649_02780 [Bacteroidales bacterium]|nr:hypothetical protein [Bacteroidales bacterium]